MTTHPNTDPLSVNPYPNQESPPFNAPFGAQEWLPPMMGHLTELRSRLLWAVSLTAVNVAIALCFAEALTRLFLQLAPKGVQFIQLTPGEAFMASIKLSVLLGVAASAPVWLYHTVCFILPGLLAHERKLLFGLLGGGLLLFAMGCAFGLGAVAPVTVNWLLAFGESLAVNQLSIGRYLDFVLMITLLTGVSFELPLVLVGLVASGVLPKRQLLARWRQGLIAVFILSALLTPGQDPFSMVLVGGALSLLFALSLLVIRYLPNH